MAFFSRGAAFALLASLVCAGCATSTAVSLPGGGTGYDVSCAGGRWACTGEAESVCGGRPYVVLDESTALAVMSKDQQGSMRIQCADDYVVANARARPVPRPEPGTEQAETGAMIVCRQAYKDAATFGRTWSASRGSAARATPANREDFLRTCTALPQAARPCLVVRYGEKHEAACKNAIARLDEGDRSSLDALFLASPPADAADSTAGDSDDASESPRDRTAPPATNRSL